MSGCGRATRMRQSNRGEPPRTWTALHAIYDRITVAGPEIMGVRLAQAAHAHGLALALPEKVVMARPTGVGRAITAYDLPIEGRDEWIAAARRLA
jgi:hypothetical protein